MSNNDIKLGVSLYSLSSLYNTRRLDFEGLLKTVKNMGYEGIEIVAAQMVPEYPNPSDEWLEGLKNLLKKYDLKLVCWSAYIDMGIRTDRDLSEEEIIQYTRNDLIYAKKAGAELVRTQHAITPEIFRKMVPFCKEIGMKLAIEMHSPHHPNVPVWKEYLKLMADPASEGLLGIVPDFSIFQHTPAKLAIEMYIHDGFDEKKLRTVIKMHDGGNSMEQTLSSDEFTAYEKHVIGEIYHTCSSPAKLSDLKKLIPYSFYIHGKFYYIEEDCTDPSIHYDQIIPIIKELGYKGYIASEYEGHLFSLDNDPVEQLSRYVTMNRRLLDY
jgi:sugar phosphate isomerase/epimerase